MRQIDLRHLRGRGLSCLPAIVFLLLFSLLRGPATAHKTGNDPGGFTRLHFGIKGGLALAQHQGTEPREQEYTVSSSMRRGFACGPKVRDRYRLVGEVSDGEQTIPVSADTDMSEVDLCDFAFTYGLGLEFPLGGRWLRVEHRFDLGLRQLPLPTHAYVPFGEDEEILVDNEPAPLRNQAHLVLVSLGFQESSP